MGGYSDPTKAQTVPWAMSPCLALCTVPRQFTPHAQAGRKHCSPLDAMRSQLPFSTTRRASAFPVFLLLLTCLKHLFCLPILARAGYNSSSAGV